MTHPIQKPLPNAAKKQLPKQGEPFDPEELSRRLQTHLVNQKLRAEQRRKARDAKAAADLAAEQRVVPVAPKYASPGQENVYHHIPKVAASAFARTATPDPMRQFHKLSQPVRAQMDQLTLEESNGQAQTLKKTQAMDQAVAERENLRNRNQFQRDQAMEVAAEMDVYRDVYKPPQRTFMSDFSHLIPGQDKKTQRPMSTGDMLDHDDPFTTTTKTKRKSKPNGFDMTERNNWAQQDEPESKSSKKEKDKETTSVRRKPSSWILLGRRSPKLEKEKEKDEAVAGIGETGSPPDGSKSTKSSFLARFRRHPS